jgi:hypothetical protein
MRTTISRLRIRLSNFFRRLFKKHSPSLEWPSIMDICPNGLCNTPSIEPSTNIDADVLQKAVRAFLGDDEPSEEPANEPCTDEEGNE